MLVEYFGKHGHYAANTFNDSAFYWPELDGDETTRNAPILDWKNQEHVDVLVCWRGVND
jgi:hypothetical protein